MVITIIRLSCEHCGGASELTTEVLEGGRISIENNNDEIECPQCGKMALSWSDEPWDETPAEIKKFNLLS